MLLVLLGLEWLAWMWWRRWSPQAAVTAKVQRLQRPRTPADCPACCQQATGATRALLLCSPVRPWHELKRRRGAPKRIATDGFACPNRWCPYYHITDAPIHALVGDGKHGTHERIQTFRCQACGTTFSARRHTALYRLKTASSWVAEVLTALAERLDVAAATRVFDHRHATITRWVLRAGNHSATLHERWFCHLYLPYLQLDELRTRLRSHAHTLWLWVAIDPITIADSGAAPRRPDSSVRPRAHPRRAAAAGSRCLRAMGSGSIFMR
jgi:hypothetical protein